MASKINIVRMSTIHRLICNFKAIPITILTDILKKLAKNSFNFICEYKEHGGAQQQEMTRLDDINGPTYDDQRLGRTHLAPGGEMDTQPAAIQ